jgi:FixJ family two-component response regulator
MADRAIRVLLVEDDEADYQITRSLLAAVHGGCFQLDRAATYDTGLRAVARHEHDVYLIDYRLGARTGLELLREAIAGDCKAPIIFLTGMDDHRVDIEAMKSGAADYLTKGRMDSEVLERAIRYAVERKHAADALHEAHEELKVAHQRALQSERLAAIGEMVAGLAHESRNALQQIQASLEMLARRIEGQPAERFVVEIQTNLDTVQEQSYDGIDLGSSCHHG